MIGKGMKYLIWFAHEHVPFRMPELDAIASMFGIAIKFIEQPHKEPYAIVELASEEDAKKLASRSVLIRSIIELWAHAGDIDDVCDQVKKFPAKFWDAYGGEDQSFKFSVEIFGKRKVPREVKVEKIEKFDFLPLNGPIKMENPDHTYHLIEYYGIVPNYIPEKPHAVFFGRWICDGQRFLKSHLALRTRKFIANTSMDPTLSVIMANMAKVKKSHLILDPFVGSGSLLVPAAFFGAYVLGTDLDYLLLHGKAPYGIREATERIGTHKTYDIPGHLAAQHVPSKVAYCLKDVLCDLLNFSAHHLCLNGRLVFWMPIYNEDFSEDSLPQHPCLKLIAYSEQSLSKHSSRLLITMEKTSEPDETSCAVMSSTAERFRERYFAGTKGKADNTKS
ncbi:tRNA (guanine(10)-N(2))-methyltransferase homolog isoform X2 [Dermacentor albipictus]|uniref:tRNA (guanine(10)-N(2))-methyltransferase homolog isoform X2 n=1 Tax=Dermacentor albipictus TaxID=60249 RepID=UPI0038FCF39E